MADTKWSQFPSASEAYANDEVVGLKNGQNSRFSLAKILALIRQNLSSIFVPISQKGVANGVASLDANGKVPSGQLPPIASTAADVTYDNTQSGLTADDVQEAIDELAAGAGGGGVDPETIAPVEETTTATVAHPLGTVFYFNDLLYRALADIPVGGTINTAAGGNATQTSIAQNFKRTVTLTSAEYAQLSAAEKAADIVYIVTDDNATSAEVVSYDPTNSGLTATDAQAALDELAEDKANQAQLAYVESGTTASRPYAVGEYFCWNGLLYKAKTAISSGGTFTPETNCEQTTTVKIGEYWEDITSQFSAISGSTLKVLVNPAIRTVRLFFLADGLANGSTAVTIPTQYAPDTAKLVYVSSTDSYRIGIFHGRFTQTPSSLGNIYEFHSFLRYYSGNRQIAPYYPLANPAYAVTFDIEYVY